MGLVGMNKLERYLKPRWVLHPLLIRLVGARVGSRVGDICGKDGGEIRSLNLSRKQYNESPDPTRK